MVDDRQRRRSVDSRRDSGSGSSMNSSNEKRVKRSAR